MKTDLIYLEDSYRKEMDAAVLEVAHEGDGKWRLLLDKTVFYPMGGGQPTDQGVLSYNQIDAQVYQVMMKDGEVWHYISSSQAPKAGGTVHGLINWERRYKNMKVHSAGHVVDFAMYVLGYSPTRLMPMKADHSKKPYIVYQGVIDEDIRQRLEEKANELVKKDLEISWDFQPLEELKKEAIYLQPGLPTNKPLRTLRLEGVGAVADGGTQVRKTSEVGEIQIPEIVSENGNTIVKYSLK